MENLSINLTSCYLAASKIFWLLQEYDDEYNGRLEEDDFENKLALREG